MIKLRTFFVLLAAFAVAAPVFAHHGRGRAYDMKNPVTLKGTVSLVKWQNPHVLIYMDVKDASGKVVTWGFENRNTLKLGQEITAIVNPAVNGEPLGIIVKVILADGKEIMSRERGNPLD
jgi:hypothetical protein